MENAPSQTGEVLRACERRQVGAYRIGFLEESRRSVARTASRRWWPEPF